MKKILILFLFFLTACTQSSDKNIIDFETSAITQEEITFNYDYYKNINEDFIGYLQFENGLLEQPVFQGETNNTYLRTNWETLDYDVMGSVFIDCDSKLDDQNIIIYGHYVYDYLDPERKIMFTPLERLQDKEVYNDNKYIRLYLENEVRLYKVVSTFMVEVNEYDTVDENLRYYLSSYDDKYFRKYKSRIKDVEFYNSGEDFSADDNFLTLQTCTDDENYRQIVLCKLVSSKGYKNA